MSAASRSANFLTAIIEADRAAGKNGGRVVTRFPPEPNGFLHIGHAKSILLNFGLAKEFGGRAHLRFDDTNPTTEDASFVEAIKEDVRWLGCDWGAHLYFASDHFERMYACAERLIREGKAYVDDQNVDAIREGRGSFERPGRNSPHRERGADENLELFRSMRAGAVPDGARVLRAKIDMAHPNVILRDPLLYRVRHAHHHRTGDRWCIYPMYDFAHPLEDAFEGVTHSICTLEFESNRELYDWVLDSLGPWDPRPRQYEFARLSLGYTVMSKRRLLQLVNERRVSGWDDPRMPTLAGMRRRGVTPEALRDFAELIGVAKNNSVVDLGKLEFAIRGDLEGRSPRAMAVLRPLRIVVTNWPEDHVEQLTIPWWPGEPDRGGSRLVPFGREVLIEQEDFSEDPPEDWRRLAPGREVRLIGAYVVRCDHVTRNAAGEIEALACTYDPSSKGGAPADGRKVSGTLHWVHATRSCPAPVRLYDRLFHDEQPSAEGDLAAALNPESLVVAEGARIEPALARAAAASHFQFVRLGYFFADPVDSRDGAPAWNRTISLKDTWTKVAVAPAPERRAKVRVEEDAAPAAAPKRSRSEFRAERRAAAPALAERFARYQAELSLSKDDADVLTGDAALAEYFDAALGAHPRAPSVARWLLNDLLGLARDTSVAALPLTGAGFGRFVALVDDGRVTAAAGKTLLADLVARGGDAEARLAELKLGRVDDGASIVAAVARVLAAREGEVLRYRAGETKLLGVLMGAVMKETQGASDAAAVRKALLDGLG